MDVTATPPPWLAEIARRFYETVRDNHAMPRVRDAIRQWQADQEAQEDARDRWRARRVKHLRKLLRLPADHPLRADTPNPPHRGWRREWADVPARVRKGPLPVPTSSFVAGWVPPALCYEAEPSVTRIVPIPDRQLKTYEILTLLAAITDDALRGTTKADPWEIGDPDDRRQGQEWMSYFVLRRTVAGGLGPTDRQSLEALLGDARRELETGVGKATAEPATEAPPSKPIANGATDLKGKATGDGQGETPPPATAQGEPTDPPEARRCVPMSLVEMATRLGNMPPAKFKQIAEAMWGLQRLTRQRWTVRLDLMDTATAHRIERGRPIQ